jgi:hypothetical protein
MDDTALACVHRLPRSYFLAGHDLLRDGAGLLA